MNGPRLDARRRAAYGTRFGRQAELYDRVRPGYPEAAVRSLHALAAGPVCDVGSGTGKLAGALAAAGAHVIAVDPDAQLLARNPCESRPGRAEALPIDNATISLLTVAQAWHWLDPGRACAEFARVLRPGGHVAVLNNQLDVRAGWVLRLSRIMHAGDVYRPAWRPALSGPFGPVAAEVFTFTQTVDVEAVVALARTRSYWLRAAPDVRARVEDNIREYLTGEALADEGFAAAGHGGTAFELPYLCLQYVAERR